MCNQWRTISKTSGLFKQEESIDVILCRHYVTYDIRLFLCLKRNTDFNYRPVRDIMSYQY